MFITSFDINCHSRWLLATDSIADIREDIREDIRADIREDIQKNIREVLN